ncbi:MAG TPA: VWA domain-containing protein [Bryobacteraceae bacterium]|nr:VWA domain-containing protein [Bryobacteraceae bacterium]
MHHRNNGILTIASLALLLAGATGLAQQIQAPQPPQPPSGGGGDETGTVFRANTRLVVLHVTVIDKGGHLVTTLPKDDFRVFENGTPQEIRTFRQEDIPVSIGLIIDNSGSMRDKRAKVEAAALALVEASNKQDEVFVVNFNDEAFLDNPHGRDFTSDIGEMKEALTRIDSRGGTAMRDAIRMSIDHLKEKAHKDKKVLVVVTDGNDNSSIISLENLVKAAQQSEVLVYSVGLLSDEERREAKRAERALQTLAEATGGEAFFPKELSEVDRIAHQVARDIRNQYTITYTPTNQTLDGTYRQIKVTVNAPGHPIVRTRSGYYATPDQAGPSARPKSTP